jgi:hypothetical protein
MHAVLTIVLLSSCAEVTDVPLFRAFDLGDDDTSTGDDDSGDDDSAGDDDTVAPCDLGWVVVGADEVSFEDEVVPLFTGHCGPCHTEQGLGGMSLSPSQAWANIVDQPNTVGWGPIDRVEPGSPEGSYLLHKVVGCSPEDPVWGYSFAEMPPAFPGVVPLDQEQLSTLWTWIVQGALDN